MDFSGFYKKPFDERLEIIRKITGLSDPEMAALKSGGLTLPEAEVMRENVIGLYSLPFSVATNFVVNGKEYLIPMVGEEPSVVAAASKAAKIAREFGGFTASSTDPVMIGEVHIKNPDEQAHEIVEANRDPILKFIDDTIPSMKERGGGARDVWATTYTSSRGRFLVVYFSVDVRDSMGANTINRVAESLGPLLVEMVGGSANMCILSNLCLKRISRAKAYFSLDKDVIESILDAQSFAENDIYRAVTHNKGIMNGISALALATGNDTRAVESGAHGYAMYSSFYRPLTKYYVEDRKLAGEIEVPLALGTVGSGTNHRVARIALDKILKVTSSQELCSVAAALGLAQNFAALYALTREGINKGHMRLHSRVLALAAGATPDEANKVYEYFKGRENEISMSSIRAYLDTLRTKSKKTK
ncbi:MAG: hydroxymethylglutaryl-CoA reductase, degradative [Candidatus Micrarchaeia archaeon]